MKIYNCDVCGSLIYFENTICLTCSSPLGYLPFLDNMSSLESVGGNRWKSLAPSSQGMIYKKCQNYHQENVCNWMIPETHPNQFCFSCNLNEVIPDLSIPANRDYWHRIEVAKRRLVYSLLRLGLPVQSKKLNPESGLSFSFLADAEGPDVEESEKVLTGHDQGMITININEADDAVREKMRLDMNERYRTLLGHFRHEIGHYYWSLLIQEDAELLSQFRALFGDENQKYDECLKRYYSKGARPDWQQSYVSAYASSHPWEDWAETWAHFLHMFDTLETARSWGLAVKLRKGNEVKAIHLEHDLQSFEQMQDLWIHLSSALNSLNRSMGMKDVYPFVWSDSVIEKLRFIQKIIIRFQGAAT